MHIRRRRSSLFGHRRSHSIRWVADCEPTSFVLVATIRKLNAKCPCVVRLLRLYGVPVEAGDLRTAEGDTKRFSSRPPPPLPVCPPPRAMMEKISPKRVGTGVPIADEKKLFAAQPLETQSFSLSLLFLSAIIRFGRIVFLASFFLAGSRVVLLKLLPPPPF